MHKSEFPFGPYFNYSMLISLVTAYMPGHLGEHVCFINALGCCEGYLVDDERIFKTNGTGYSAVLSGMKQATRPVPMDMKTFFRNGKFKNTRYHIPTAERFMHLVGEDWTMSRDDEEKCKDIILYYLDHGKNIAYLDQCDVQKLKTSLFEDDFIIALYNCFQFVLFSGWNTVNKKKLKSTTERTTQTAMQVEATIPYGIAELHELDDSV